MITGNRRELILGTAATMIGGTLGLHPTEALAAPEPTSLSKPFFPAAGPRSRVVLVNDLSGDIDGLFATVHAILSPTAALQSIVGTGSQMPGETAFQSAAIGREILELMGMTGRVNVFEGAATKLPGDKTPVRSPGTQAIIDEAMRTDTSLPLYVTVGGGLTEVASALMLEPRIAGRFTLVWIGGDAYPAGGTGETNFNIDASAAQFLYNQTNVPIWQVPRSVYATCLVSATELQAFVAPHGAIGEWLYRKVVDMPGRFRNMLNMGETWTLGDSPLVVLTALGDWNPSGSGRPFKYEKTDSSLYDLMPAPRLNPDGTFTPTTDGRPIRIYRSIDTRMMFSDFFAKLRVHYGR